MIASGLLMPPAVVLVAACTSQARLSHRHCLNSTLLGSHTTGSRFGHNVRRPTQFVCTNKDTTCPNSDKIYLTIVTSKFLLLFFAY